MPMSRRNIDAWSRVYLAAAVVIGFFAIFILLFFVTVPEANQRPVDIMLGALTGGGFVLVMMHFFGSSSGSKSKDDAMARLAEPDEPPAPPAS